ncbi:hypothetical protein TNCT_474751 [Trichonephila clavata]|uniref:Uncharacterized protein n=1 Tax=Trichonephila clavata TaxID=2740835 RepID=A0A8X6H2A1_TRICU|nr:hypothetical protein TNCT_474751 [Trichonephila clavata]
MLLIFLRTGSERDGQRGVQAISLDVPYPQCWREGFHRVRDRAHFSSGRSKGDIKMEKFLLLEMIFNFLWHSLGIIVLRDECSVEGKRASNLARVRNTFRGNIVLGTGRLDIKSFHYDEDKSFGLQILKFLTMRV